MSYKIVTTYTKTADSPENAFNTMPVLSVESLGNVTQEQIDTLQNNTLQWERRIIGNQLIMTHTYNSESDYNARLDDPVAQDLRASRRAWAELNNVTISSRVV
jgi:hypothetical protein